MNSQFHFIFITIEKCSFNLLFSVWFLISLLIYLKESIIKKNRSIDKK